MTKHNDYGIVFQNKGVIDAWRNKVNILESNKFLALFETMRLICYKDG
ncbi:hypothetical protein [Anaerofustis stercorihominis]|nr:hypothetical protein [Anaerofustis stercorihominis]